MSGTAASFLYDAGQVIEELQGSTTAAEKLSGTVYWMLQDGQPSTRQLLNSSQTVVDTYTTDAFGNSVARTGTAVNPFQWNAGGKYYSDSESGLQKVGARYYEPTTGRWMSQDSLLVAGSPGDTQAVDRFLYCHGSPAGSADPTGRSAVHFDGHRIRYYHSHTSSGDSGLPGQEVVGIVTGIGGYAAPAGGGEIAGAGQALGEGIPVIVTYGQQAQDYIDAIDGDQRQEQEAERQAAIAQQRLVNLNNDINPRE